MYPPEEGEILFEGQSILGLDPHQIARRGIARTFQTLRLFLNMTVKENVMAAAYGHTQAGVLRSVLRTPGMRREEREIEQLAEERLAFFGDRLVGYRWRQPAYSLSYANRRRLEIARATAAKPRLLLLDEPAAGMNPVETHEMTELIARLREEGGYTILVIEHDMHVVEGISDRVVALDHGVKIAEGSFAQRWRPTRGWSRHTWARPTTRAQVSSANSAAPSRCSGSRASTPTTVRCTSSRTSTSRWARASSSACSAGTPPGSRRR